MKTAGIALLASMFIGLCIGSTSAQRGEQYPRPGYGPGAPTSGMAPYGSSRGPVPMSRPGSYNPGYSQSVPSTRFAPAPESTGRSAPQLGQSPYQSYSGPPYGPGASAPVSPGASGMQQGYQRPENEGRGVRSRADDLQRMSPDLTVEDRLKVPLLNSMYRQGTDMLDEGRNSGDKSKVEMGLQQINEANERVDRLEREFGSGRGQDNDRDRPANSGRSNGRRERR